MITENTELSTKPLILGFIGIPCSGKTTLANWLKKTIPNTVIICRDDIRAELKAKEGVEFSWAEYDLSKNREFEDEVTRIHKSRFIEALKSEQNVILADTWLREEYRIPYNKIANNFDNNICWEYLHVNMYEAIQRDKKRDNPVGEKAIKHLHACLLKPENRPFIYEYFYNRMKSSIIEYIAHGGTPANYMISDLDGSFVTRDTSKPDVREWYDFHRVDEDVANTNVTNLVMQTASSQNLELAFVTGRDGSIAYDKSVECLTREMTKLGYNQSFTLDCRGKDDRRPDWLTKLEIIANIVEKRGAYPKYMFDDRSIVVEAFREVLGNNTTILQVDKGNF